MGRTPQRRPGDGNDWDDVKHDPNADFLGTQFGSGGSSGYAISLYRLIRFLFNRRSGGRHL